MLVPRGAWFGDEDEQDREVRLSNEEEDAVNYWGEDVWNFCTGVWPLPTRTGAKGTRTPRPIIWTQDKLRREVRHFPNDEYIRYAILRPIFSAPKLDSFGQPFRLRMALWKPRQVFATNAILIGDLHDVIYHDATEWLIAKNKKPEAERFVAERVRFTYQRLPEFFRRWANAPRIPKGLFRVPRTGSSILPVARTFGESGEAIGETASVLLDEAIRFRGLRAVWMAADAQAPRLIAISAPPERGVRIDPESLAFFRELIEGLPEGTLTRAIAGMEDVRLDEPDDDDDLPTDVTAWTA